MDRNKTEWLDLHLGEVWFDDLKVTHTQHLVTQATDYGVWGDVLREQKSDESTYRFGYQGQFAEKDEETGWNHFELREYDPVVGRWMVLILNDRVFLRMLECGIAL